MYRSLLYTRQWDLEIATDRSAQTVVDLLVTRNSGDLSGSMVDVERVLGTLAHQFAPMRRFQVSEQITAFLGRC